MEKEFTDEDIEHLRHKDFFEKEHPANCRCAYHDLEYIVKGGKVVKNKHYRKKNITMLSDEKDWLIKDTEYKKIK